LTILLVVCLNGNSVVIAFVTLLFYTILLKNVWMSLYKSIYIPNNMEKFLITPAD